MLAKLAFRSLLPVVLCGLVVLPWAGCSNDTAPVETSGNEIDQFLQQNPDEAYTSDDIADEMEEDDGEGEGEG